MEKTLKVDDLSGDPLTEETGGETISFAVRGVGYLIDLTSVNVRAFDQCVAPFIEAARKDVVRPGRSRAGQRSTKSEDTAPIRKWAAETGWSERTGLRINDRGRLPNQVIRDYENRDRAGAVPENS